MSTQTQELKHRVEAKKKELESKLEHMKADAAGSSDDAKRSLKQRIEKLDRTMRDGFDDLTDEAARKINALLDDRD